MRESIEEYNNRHYHNLHKRRLKAVKKRYVFLPKQCDCCGYLISKENMWKVKRWGFWHTVHTWYYCQNCMPTPEDVLNKIYENSYSFGIAGVDDY